MRAAFVHVAALTLDRGDDLGAPGAAITVALCGHWEHEGDCRWPHHTAVDTVVGAGLTIRTTFASEPDEVDTVRAGISAGLRTGRLDGPHGLVEWTVTSEGPSVPGPDELAMAARWIT
jgi:hypothetical protein